MRRTKREIELEKELASARLQTGIANGEKRKFEAEAVRLQRQLDQALDELRVAKATVRTIVLGCKFEEVQSRPRDHYGS